MRARIASLSCVLNNGNCCPRACCAFSERFSEAPSRPKTSIPIRPLVDLSRSIELTIALNRSSWERKALSTSQTTLKRLLLRMASSGDSLASIATGRMM